MPEWEYCGLATYSGAYPFNIPGLQSAAERAEKGSFWPVGLSTWFIAAIPNHPIVTSVLDALLAYWKDYDCLVDYYIIHLFMSEALRNNPGVMATMPRENSHNSLLLGNALGKDFSESDWKNLTEHVSIHKLNYRKAEEAKENPNGYYRHIIGQR